MQPTTPQSPGRQHLRSRASRAFSKHLLPLGLSLLAVVPASQGQSSGTLTTLHTFTGRDGADPTAGLLLGTDGNLYGTTSGDGTSNDGTIFKITTAGALTTLYTFNGSSSGSTPVGGLVQGGAGNLYGTTSDLAGGTAGTVFRITTSGALTTLYTFTGSTDGSTPEATLLLDGTTLVGTTTGGKDGFGSVFEAATSGSFGIIYDFTGGTDGGVPTGSVVLGGDGNLYGTTSSDGGDGEGTIFQINPAGTLSTLYTFTGGTDGGNPAAGLVRPGDGYFYGTTSTGGSGGNGTVFRVTTSGTLTTLHTFTGDADGASPAANLLVGSDGALYGTTSTGGSDGDGTIFKITTAGAFTLLYTFTGGGDGSTPLGSLVEDSNGNFYGTTSAGGGDKDGTVFKLSIVADFFDGAAALADGVYYLAFPNGNDFGYYSFLADASYLYHFDLGYEYVFDADDGNDGVYLYDFASKDFFYTSPSFPFPYLYDFGLNTVLYYYPDTSRAGHYTSNPRYFYNFGTGTIISK